MDFHNIDDYFHENSPAQGGEGAAEASAEAILERVYRDTAFGSEKLLNLDMLVMEIARRASDIEPLMWDPRSISSESVGKAFEFDVLHGIVDSEVSELEKLAASIQTDIGNAETKALGGEPGSRVTDELCARKESLKQMQDVISDIRTQLATFENAIQPSHGKQGMLKTFTLRTTANLISSVDQTHFLTTAKKQILQEIVRVWDMKMVIYQVTLLCRLRTREMYCRCYNSR
jgi:hypothetical protein